MLETGRCDAISEAYANLKYIPTVYNMWKHVVLRSYTLDSHPLRNCRYCVRMVRGVFLVRGYPRLEMRRVPLNRFMWRSALCLNLK